MEVRHLSFVGQLVRIDLLSTMTRGLTFVGRCDNALAEPHRWWEGPNYEGQIPQKRWLLFGSKLPTVAGGEGSVLYNSRAGARVHFG
jgi:hypothetical protein